MRFIIPLLLALVLTGCMTAETTSVVSLSAIPPGRYHKIIILVEGVNDSDRNGIEHILEGELRGAPVEFDAGSALFAGKNLSPADKVELIRNQGFDAALYVNVTRKDLDTELMPGWTFDGNTFQSPPGEGISVGIGVNLPNPYLVEPDGRVVKQTLVFISESKLRDTNTGIVVWQANSSATVNVKFGNMPSLVQKVAEDIVAKLRSDKALR